MNAIRDDFNPKFVYFSPVDGDLAAHVDGAIRTYCGEACVPVGELVLESLGTPAAGTMRVDLWVESLDDTSVTYGFLCSNANGSAAYARGERTVRKNAGRSERRLLRDLHAFA
ncbi:MAG TPA: hypothetical protein VI670_24720 [Thermoanaerobaculia bacterium]|jgi:hypothetical protein